MSQTLIGLAGGRAMRPRDHSLGEPRVSAAIILFALIGYATWRQRHERP